MCIVYTAVYGVDLDLFLRKSRQVRKWLTRRKKYTHDYWK